MKVLQADIFSAIDMAKTHTVDPHDDLTRVSTPPFSKNAIRTNQEDVGGDQLASDGISRALEASNAEIRGRAMHKLKNLLTDHKRVTADDLEGYGDPDHVNMMGGIFQEAAARGWCEFQGQYVPSNIPRKHRRPLRVWESLLHDQ